MAGVMEMTDDMPSEMPAHWQVYFIVENADKAIEQATSNGSKLGFGPIDVPVGRMATLVDPQGAAVSIIEAHYPEPR
jgi:predicted enzyme related to lactoylglutathione lyase